MTSTAVSYDQHSYPSYPYSQTHPDRLATIATLFGMRPPDVEHCRVLELGCAGGGNLLPMAEQLPGSSFVGIDLSTKQIEQAIKATRAVGLTNIEFQVLDLREIDETFGEFDYIICHGLYTWVPRELQPQIMQLCRDRLTANGVAYISYNTLPGWHIRGMTREMMQFHIAQFDDTETRLTQARSLMEFLASATAKLSATYSTVLNHELDVIRRKRDEHLLHDHLEEINEPIYFHRFCDDCREADMQYLGEANFSAMWTGSLPADVAETLNKMSTDLIRREQYLDFLRNRMFRESLICHADVKLSRNLNVDSLRKLYVASRLDPQTEHADLRSGVAVLFSDPAGKTIMVSGSLTKAALLVLKDRWPESLSFAELLKAASERLGLRIEDITETDQQVFGKDLINCYGEQRIELRSHPDPYTREIGETPRGSQLARTVSQTQPVVPNLAHQFVPLGDVERIVLRLLDGQRDRSTIVKELEQAIARDEIRLDIGGQPVSGGKQSHDLLVPLVDETLKQLALKGLLCR